jgi:hypothetical protein
VGAARQDCCHTAWQVQLLHHGQPAANSLTHRSNWGLRNVRLCGGSHCVWRHQTLMFSLFVFELLCSMWQMSLLLH